MHSHYLIVSKQALTHFRRKNCKQTGLNTIALFGLVNNCLQNTELDQEAQTAITISRVNDFISSTCTLNITHTKINSGNWKSRIYSNTNINIP
jgi:hypothetical protein